MGALSLTADDFVRLTGCSPVPARRVIDDHRALDLSYRELTAEEQGQVVTSIERMIESRQLRAVGGNDPAIWEQGWREVAETLGGRAVTLESLRPQYFRGEPICRLEGRYVRGLAPGFDYETGLILRRLIFDGYLQGFDTVVEIGCGTGLNLLLLAEQFPRMRLVGCDWAEASRDILAQMARETGRSIVGRVFNMLTATGWDGGEIDRTAAVLTVHAMEQLGPNWQAFVEFLRRRRPGLCLHVEPLLELYDDSAFDDRARRYHLKRNYLAGFQRYVSALAAKGEATLLAARRVRFGGLYHDAYSVLAWRPGG
jgi:SAM-dependent methyltransferase